jgi:murein DD-endopeptidase MepM/ murein hydrolase activator NlpD
MKRRQSPRAFPLVAVLVAFAAGALVDSLLRTYGPPQPVDAPSLIAAAPTKTETAPPAAADRPRAAIGPPRAAPAPNTPTATTGSSPLRLPIDGMNLDAVKGGFFERRGTRPHEAVDILAPRNTPIHAVQNGTIARLFTSKQGGLTIYQFDPSGHLCYYYAHLEKYADNLHEGDSVTQGQVIGYVGTSGNAPPNTPHLHFAVMQVGDQKQWWKGQAIDPYPLLKGKANS